MPVIQIDEKELLHKSSKPKRVGENGYISVGRVNKGKLVHVYIVEAK